MSSVIRVEGLRLQVGAGARRFDVLHGLDLAVEPGESLAILGRSGSGKSSLLSVLGLLQRPTSGTYQLGGQDVSTMSERDRSRARSAVLGFVFQGYSLVPQLTALHNVMVPFSYGSRVRHRTARQRAREVLDAVGLDDRRDLYPRHLSGGEQQRVAIARALVRRPAVILADEPTGALDVATGSDVMNLMTRVMQDQGTSLVLVTHDRENAQRMGRVLHLSEGVLQPELPSDPP